LPVSEMNNIKMGFITGCLNKQKTITPEQLYHQQILQILKQQYSACTFEIALASYVSYSQFHEATINFIENINPDIVFIFLRPFPLMPLNKPLIKYKKDEENIAWSMHPSLFNRKNFQWDEKFSKYEKEIKFNHKHRWKFELRDLNLLSGLLLGLNRWCAKFLVNNLNAIYNNENGGSKKLFFISLPKNPESLMGNYVCRVTNRKIVSRLPKEISFIDISYIKKDAFENDGIHFNEIGHYQLAKTLLAVINEEVGCSNKKTPNDCTAFGVYEKL
jgi:hypothetical protein